MKIKVLAIMLSGLILVACNGQPSQTKQPENPSTPVAASETAPVASSQIVAASDVAQNQVVGFEDKMGDENFLPEGVDAKDVISLKYNEKDDITLYEVKLAQKGSVEKIYENLNKIIADKANGISGEVKKTDDGKIAYTFNQVDKDGANVLNESCLMNISAEHIDSVVCAYSPSADTATLQNALAK